jgi:3-oxoacyl-[acyl-carrier-protein] synthase-3
VKKKRNGFEILHSMQGTDGSRSNFAIIKAFGNKYRKSKNKNDHFISIDGPGLYNFALDTIPKQINNFKKKFNIKDRDIDYYFFHQANKFMIEGLVRSMKLDQKKVIIDMQDTGNTTSSSIPIILKKNQFRIKKNKKIIIAGFGGGLSWGITLLKKV